jgi:hypothetical protein
MQLEVLAHQDPDEQRDRAEGQDEVVPQRMSGAVVTEVADVGRREHDHGQPAIWDTVAPLVPATALSAFQRAISVSMCEAGSGRENR